jgi:predicted unusual protein kinase regulating ubiquinone biosynthesis (AarF/ABC1/UbiB family)
MAWELVVDVVRDELGAHPEELFERFSHVPIAAASIGQVHAATTRDGREVVVKVQYPGVADAIEADLRNTALLSTLANLAKTFAGPLQPRTDVKALAAELRDRVVEELDYEREAANQDRFLDLWRDDPLVRIPAVDHALSSRRGLTQAYHDGMRWPAAIEESQELRNRWAETIYRFVFTSLYHHHVFNADPHPGNYLFHEDGGVTFVDFGCVREFTPEQVDDLRETGRAVVGRDPERLVARMERAGWYPHGRRSSPEEVLTYIAPGWAPLSAPQPFTFTREWAADTVQRQLGLTPGELRVVNEMSPPPHNLFLGRISVGLFSVLTGLGATSDWRARFLEIETWPELAEL